MVRVVSFLFVLIFTLIVSFVLYNYFFTLDSDFLLSENQVPDFNAQSIRLTRYDEKGDLIYQVVANRLVYFNNHDSEILMFSKPFFSLYEDRLLAWTLKSDDGLFFERNHLNLLHNIVIKNYQSNSSIRSLNAIVANFYLDSYFLESHDFVILKGDSYLTEGVNFEGYLKQETYSFLEQSYAEFF